MLTQEEHAEKWSELWDSISDLEHREEGSAMWEFYRVFIGDYDFSGKEVIELGCGTGINTILMGKLGAKITFVDISRKALDIVRRNAERFGVEADYIHTDIFEFKTEKKYDLVHSEGVVEHFLPPKRQRILDIHADILKPGGRAVIIVPNKSCPGYRVGKRLANFFGNWVYGDEFPYSEFELKERMEKAGFRIEKRAGGEFVTSCVWYFAPLFLSSKKFMKRSLRFMPGRRMLMLDQDHWFANRFGRIIGFSGIKK